MTVTLRGGLDQKKSEKKENRVSSKTGREGDKRGRESLQRETLTTVVGFPHLSLRVYPDCLSVCSLKPVPELKRLT